MSGSGATRSVPPGHPGAGRVDATLVVWRSDPAGLAGLLLSLAAQTLPVTTLRVLVNEDPSGQCAQQVRTTAARVAPGLAVVVTAEGANTGYAGGQNRLLADAFAAGAGGVLILTPDVVCDPGALAALHDAHLPAASLRGPLLLAADPATGAPEGRIDSAGIVWTRSARHLDARQGEAATAVPAGPYRVAGVTGACLYVTAAGYEAVVAATGEFLDEAFLAYREDAELGLRAGRVGVASYVVPAARGLHVRQVRGTRRRGVSEHVNRLGVRNRLLIRFKHGRARPGGWIAAPARDLVVVAGAALVERSSWPGVADAWSQRDRMRAKGALVTAAARRAGTDRR